MTLETGELFSPPSSGLRREWPPPHSSEPDYLRIMMCLCERIAKVEKISNGGLLCVKQGGEHRSYRRRHIFATFAVSYKTL